MTTMMQTEPVDDVAAASGVAMNCSSYDDAADDDYCCPVSMTTLSRHACSD